jgi:hypothetical protein
VLRRLLVLIVTVAVGWVIAQFQNRPSPLPTPARAEQPAATSAGNPSPALSSQAVRRDIGFRSRDRLVDHYEKHGREFGRISMEEYLAQAQALRDRPLDNMVLELVRTTDGVVSRFDKGSGAFLAFNRDYTIRTYFKPNDGEDYFRRQANRRPGR